MRFGALLKHVERAETLVEGRSLEAQQHWGELRQAWRAGWTPVRIVVAGLGLGFVAGRTEPQVAIGSIARKVGGLPKLLQMATTVSAMFTASQAKDASQQAERAADQAQEAADDDAPATVVVPVPVGGRRTPLHAAEPQAPRPAEAATEMSER